MLKVNKKNSGKVGFIRLIRKGEFLPYRHSHIFHPRNRGQRTISLEIYDCAASSILDTSPSTTSTKSAPEFQKIGDLKFSIEDKKKKKSKSRPRNGTYTACESPLIMGTGSESQSSSIDARKLDICVSFLLDPFGVLTVSNMSATTQSRSHGSVRNAQSYGSERVSSLTFSNHRENIHKRIS